MLSSTTKSCCVACGRETTVLKCRDCWKKGDNSQLITQFQAINDPVIEEKDKAQQHAWTEQVNEWESHALNQIRSMTEETRRLVLNYKSDHISQIIANLSKVTDQLRQCYEENNSIAQKISQEHEESVRLSRALGRDSTDEQSEIANEGKILLHERYHVRREIATKTMTI